MKSNSKSKIKVSEMATHPSVVNYKIVISTKNKGLNNE